MNEHLVLIFIYLGANQQDEASAQECDLVQQQCGGKVSRVPGEKLGVI